LLAIVATALCAEAACVDYNRLFVPGRDGEPKRLIVWAHSDIQPRDPVEMIHYEIAVRDVSDYLPGVDVAVVAGDIVHSRKSAHVYWEWFLRTRETAGIPYWFEIAGNHDANDLSAYRRHVRKPLHYAVRIGNAVFILMSDERHGSITDISDPVFRWWRRMVLENRRCVLVTVTHGSLAGSGLLSTVNPTMTIRDSGRFTEVLKIHPVDLWISGHSHLPGFLEGKRSRPWAFPETVFLDVSSVRKDRWGSIESCFLILESGSRKVTVMPRDHLSHRFSRTRAFRFSVRTAFSWEGSLPEMIPYVP
jgi:predicted phosphodiesterase